MLPEKIRVALVLGGGGARGIAHIGVLEELVDAGIPFDVIIGCSAGSIVGALYADSLDVDCVKALLEPMKCETMLDISIWKGRYGLAQGSAMTQVLDDCLEATTFEELKMPFFCVATDLWSGQLVTLGGGELVQAVKASAAIPFVYVPVNLHGRVFVDGGVIDPVPVRVAKKLDAEYIIAVDLRGNLDREFPKDLFDVAKRSADITLLWQGEACLENADIIIRPMLSHDIGTFCDDCHEQIYQAGKASARLAIPIIKEHLDRLGILLNECR
jgi:NTE family protein